MIGRYNSIDNTNAMVGKLKSEPMQAPRSKFDLSRVKLTNINIGAIIPIDVIETIPNDTFDLNYIISLLGRNPTVKAQLTGMRVYVHAIWNRMSDLWQGAQRFIDLGTSGNINLKKPTLRTKYKILNTDQQENFCVCTPMSLCDYMDVPPNYYHKTRDRIYQGYGVDTTDAQVQKHIEEYGNETIDALPYVMYQKNYIERYAPRNLLNQNKKWIPDNQDLFILPYNAEIVSNLSYNTPDEDFLCTADNQSMAYDTTNKMINPDGAFCVPQNSNDFEPKLAFIKYRQKKGDYFTQALPYSNLIRGDTPTIDLGNLDFSNSILPNEETIASLIGIGSGKIGEVKAVVNGTMSNTQNIIWGTDTWTTGGETKTARTLTTTNETLLKSYNGGGLLEALNSGKLTAKIDMATLNALESYTIFKQRMALTNGRYNEMVYAQYGISPNAQNKDAIYLGGGYLDLENIQVEQTSETSTTPLGTLAGKMQGDGLVKIGKHSFTDFGYIMVLLSIVPDSYYTQGLDRWITRITQEEVYYPILNNLAPQAILNKELIYTGDSKIDNDIYGWTQRYEDFKNRRNKVGGLIQIPYFDDSNYIMKQTYVTTPTLSNSFITLSPQNIDMSIYTTPTEPPFILACGQLVTAIREMPYITMPAGLRSNK